MIRPSQNAVTLEFGATSDPYTASSPHKGVDFSPSPDNRIYAPEVGTVHLRPSDGTCGRSIHMWVGNNHHALCHTSKYLVNDGDVVAQGEPVAIMGDTGYAFGIHLHWALAVNDKLVDPLSQVTKGSYPMDREDVNGQFRLGWNRDATQDELNYWIGRKPSELYSAIYNDPSNDAFRRKAITYDAVVAELEGEIHDNQAAAKLRKIKDIVDNQST